MWYRRLEKGGGCKADYRHFVELYSEELSAGSGHDAWISQLASDGFLCLYIQGSLIGLLDAGARPGGTVYWFLRAGVRMLKG